MKCKPTINQPRWVRVSEKNIFMVFIKNISAHSNFITLYSDNIKEKKNSNKQLKHNKDKFIN